ncbi:MAG: hypothetical protein NC084_01705 [Bacteroides sp.]|nr:hypothetical protein [Bacteroides sp.]
MAKLKTLIPPDFFNSCMKTCTVYKEDVEKLLISYRKKIITKDEVIDWVNTIRFSELFDIDDLYCDSIAGVMDELEEADERDNVLTQYNIDRYLNALEKNVEPE